MTDLQFVPVFGSNHTDAVFRGTTLVIPTMCAGMSAQIAADLYILNEQADKVGYLHSEYISPLVMNDQRSLAPAAELTLPCELFVS